MAKSTSATHLVQLVTALTWNSSFSSSPWYLYNLRACSVRQWTSRFRRYKDAHESEIIRSGPSYRQTAMPQIRVPCSSSSKSLHAASPHVHPCAQHPTAAPTLRRVLSGRTTDSLFCFVVLSLSSGTVCLIGGWRGEIEVERSLPTGETVSFRFVRAGEAKLRGRAGENDPSVAREKSR